MSVFGLLVAREARLLFRRPAELANPLVFFAIVVSLFPLAVGPESQLLQTLSPGLVWVAALLSVLLSLDGLFRSDFEDGSLEQWVLSPHPLALLVLAKVLAHWAFSGLALVLLAPLLALMLGRIAVYAIGFFDAASCYSDLAVKPPMIKERFV